MPNKANDQNISSIKTIKIPPLKTKNDNNLNSR